MVRQDLVSLNCNVETSHVEWLFIFFKCEYFELATKMRKMQTFDCIHDMFILNVLVSLLVTNLNEFVLDLLISVLIRFVMTL